jgi:hypothetical protein
MHEQDIYQYMLLEIYGTLAHSHTIRSYTEEQNRITKFYPAWVGDKLLFIEIKLCNNGCLQLPQKMSVDAPFTQFNTQYFWQCEFYIKEALNLSERCAEYSMRLGVSCKTRNNRSGTFLGLTWRYLILYWEPVHTPCFIEGRGTQASCLTLKIICL